MKNKKDDTMLWIVGGIITAFGVYEVFIKPKAVATVVPISATSTVTQAALPAPVNPVTQITSLAQKVANVVNPSSSPVAVTQQPPMTYNPGPTNTLPPSNFYVDSGPIVSTGDQSSITPVFQPVSVDQSAKEAYDSAMYAQYQSSLSGMFAKFEV